MMSFIEMNVVSSERLMTFIWKQLRMGIQTNTVYRGRRDPPTARMYQNVVKIISYAEVASAV